MRRYLTSDLHLGHKKICEFRKEYDTVVEHDEAIIQSLAELPRKSILWILGDFCFDENVLNEVNRFGPKKIYLVLGNHDVLKTQEYLDAGLEVIGPIKYKKFWLTHQPMHEQEIFHRRGCRGNIHGHIHANTMSAMLPYPYFNVNWDFWHRPVAFEEVEEHFHMMEQEDDYLSKQKEWFTVYDILGESQKLYGKLV